jgi:hypothetical protein
MGISNVYIPFNSCPINRSEYRLTITDMIVVKKNQINKEEIYLFLKYEIRQDEFVFLLNVYVYV